MNGRRNIFTVAMSVCTCTEPRFVLSGFQGPSVYSYWAIVNLKVILAR